MNYLNKRIVRVIFIFLFLSGCQTNSDSLYKYQPPQKLNDGIMVSTLDRVGLDEVRVERGVDKIRSGKFGEVHSLLVYKDGMLVLEEYFDGHLYQWNARNHHGNKVEWNGSMAHVLMSVSKSVTSACIGIAIDMGYIKEVQDSIFDYLPEYRHLGKNGKERITIEHLLTMTSGLEWEEWRESISGSQNDIVGIWQSNDPVAFVLACPLVHKPGTSFKYSGGNMIVLGEILANASGMKIDAFSEKYLFEPLGIESANWSQRFGNGVFENAGGLRLTPRDMLKFGVMYLNEGQYNGHKVLSGEWIRSSSVSYPANSNINIPGVDSGWNGYAYGWWTEPFRKFSKTIHMYFAGGWGGQKIMIAPELELVVVMTGGNFTSKEHVFKIFYKYIIGALE